MAVVTFDPDAVHAAKASVELQADAVASEATKQQGRALEVEMKLRRVQSDALVQIESDLWLLRESLGFDSMASNLRTASLQIKSIHSTFELMLHAVRESHPGQLCTLIDQHTAGIEDAFRRAYDGLASLPSQLDLWSFLRNVQHPDNLVQSFSAAGAHLSVLVQRLADVHAFLTKLESDETTLLSVLPQSAGNHAIAASTVVLVPSTSLLNVASSPIYTAMMLTRNASGEFSAVRAPAGESVKAFALAFASTLEPNGRVVNMIDADSAWFKSLGPEEQKLVQQIIARAPKDWSMHDVECVAFVALVYGFAFHKVDGLPSAPNATAFWDAYANNKQKGWTEIPNGHGMPAPGDIVVLSGGEYGHVAIVTDVTRKPDGTFDVQLAQSNIQPTKADPSPSLEHWSADKTGRILSRWDGYSVDGVIRYTG